MMKWLLGQFEKGTRPIRSLGSTRALVFGSLDARERAGTSANERDKAYIIACGKRRGYEACSKLSWAQHHLDHCRHVFAS